MPQVPKPLTLEQQRLVNAVKVTHQTLILARQVFAQEKARRVAEARRTFEMACAQIDLDMEYDMAAHASAQDEALIAAYNNDVPVRRIALDGFGNKLDGAVHQRLRELRADGRVGNRVGYQGGDDSNTALPSGVVFPETVKIDEVLDEALAVQPVMFNMAEVLHLVPGEPTYDVPSVVVTLDIRDPYRRRIEKNMRPGTPFSHALTATLYRHPATHELMTLESNEEGDIYWDHPVARWIKDHAEAAGIEFDRVVAASNA